jgi:hypothetical protein
MRTIFLVSRWTGALPEGIAVAADGAVYAGETTTGRSLKKLIPATSSPLF